MTYAAIVLFVVSRIAGHVMSKYPANHDMHMLALLLIIIVCSLLAEVIHLEPIVGAFLAGVAASRSLRGTQAREHIEVIGNTIFIPAFFFMIGMRINARRNSAHAVGQPACSRQDWCSPCSAQNFWPPGAWVGCRAIPSSIVSTCGP